MLPRFAGNGGVAFASARRSSAVLFTALEATIILGIPIGDASRAWLFCAWLLSSDFPGRNMFGMPLIAAVGVEQRSGCGVAEGS